MAWGLVHSAHAPPGEEERRGGVCTRGAGGDQGSRWRKGGEKGRKMWALEFPKLSPLYQNEEQLHMKSHM